MHPTSVVIIRYGPYESCGVVDHRTFRLEGLQAVLRDCGHSYVLEKIPDWNHVELVVKGEYVYKCNINDLHFEFLPHAVKPKLYFCIPCGDGQLDPLCQEAIEAVNNAYTHHNNT